MGFIGLNAHDLAELNMFKFHGIVSALADPARASTRCDVRKGESCVMNEGESLR